MKINVLVFSRDGGDGSFSSTLYRDEAHFVERNPEADLEAIKEHENPYEDGCFTDLEIEVDEAGRLVKSYHINAG